ncbi:hypothetical protein [Robinsoniella peoriensis]|uniref:hypothetical protein n=1 Tax=Robinsoniella peoriensis TaxID=180332 RepID=UPI001364DA77|nr:hypothetical protein [Robinsoniella peoriensis]
MTPVEHLPGQLSKMERGLPRKPTLMTGRATGYSRKQAVKKFTTYWIPTTGSPTLLQKRMPPGS